MGKAEHGAVDNYRLNTVGSIALVPVSLAQRGRGYILAGGLGAARADNKLSIYIIYSFNIIRDFYIMYIERNILAVALGF